MKKILIYLVLVATALGGFLYMNKKYGGPNLEEIKSFEDCVNAGYPVMESYPRQCRVPDGRVYAEEITPPITYNNASEDYIRVELPFPGAVTGKSFLVKGEARGYWYFEASFPVELLDKDGKVIFQAPAQAKGEWMTEDFVPFEVLVTAPEDYIGPATLVLHRDNASGLPEHDRSISFPITVEY